MRECLFFIFILFYSSTLFAGEIERLGARNPLEDRKAFLKQAVKAYKEAKSKTTAYKGSPEYLQFLENKRDDEIESSNVCAGCPNLLLLTEQVNKILQEQKKILPEDTPASVFNEIDSLEGLFYFIQAENERGEIVGGKAGCEKIDFGYQGLYPEKKELNIDNHVLLFSEDVNFKNISQIHLSEPGVRRTYFFKGTPPHEDIVVKVVANGAKPATVSYYRHKEIILRKKRKANLVKEQTLITKALKLGEEKKLKNEGVPKDEFIVDYGLQTEEDSFIPKKLTLLGLSSTTHFDSAIIRAGTEISSDKQAAEVELKSKDGKDFLKAEVDASSRVRLNTRSDFSSFAISTQIEQRNGKGSGSMQLRDEKNHELVGLSVDERGLAKIGVPMQFNVYDTGVLVDGRVVAGQDGSYGGTWVISDRNTKKRYVDIGLRTSKDSAGLSLGHSRKVFNESSRISVKFTHDEYKDRNASAGWVQFSMDF